MDYSLAGVICVQPDQIKRIEEVTGCTINDEKDLIEAIKIVLGFEL